MRNVYELNEGVLKYAGAGTNHMVLAGPGRPPDGNIAPFPRVRYSPEPPPYHETDALVIVRGPARGESQSGLTIYGGLPDQGPAVHIGGGWLVRMGHPHIITWKRPTGSSREAHCADPMWRPADAALTWADAVSGRALCGELLPLVGDELGERVEIRWLPTRAERHRAAQFGPLYRGWWRACWAAAGRYVIKDYPAIPPQCVEVVDPPGAQRAITRIAAGRFAEARIQADLGLEVVETVPSQEGTIERALSDLNRAIVGDAHWGPREWYAHKGEAPPWHCRTTMAAIAAWYGEQRLAEAVLDGDECWEHFLSRASEPDLARILEISQALGAENDPDVPDALRAAIGAAKEND